MDHPRPRQRGAERERGVVRGGTVRRAEPEAPVQAFSRSDRRTIDDYLSSNRANLPPGLARREKLPPGLERQLRRNGKLPPGLQKRLQPFPAQLERQLPPVPAGYSRVFLGNRALLLDGAKRILDLFLAGR